MNSLIIVVRTLLHDCWMLLRRFVGFTMIYLFGVVYSLILFFSINDKLNATLEQRSKPLINGTEITLGAFFVVLWKRMEGWGGGSN